MYLGYLIFLAGLSLFTRSPLAAVITVVHGPWYQKRVEGDEANLERLFGDEYREYCGRVPRWFPRVG